MWYVRDVLYAVLYVSVSCFVVRGCGVSRRYIGVCYCDMSSVVNVYIQHCTRFACVCLVCLLLCKEEGSSSVSLRLLRGGIWACMRCPCLCLCWVLG